MKKLIPESFWTGHFEPGGYNYQWTDQDTGSESLPVKLPRK